MTERERWRLRTGEPVGDAARMVDSYDANNRRLTELELSVLVDAVRQLITERQRMMRSMAVLRSTWPQMREALNVIEAVIGPTGPRRQLARRRGEPR